MPRRLLFLVLVILASQAWPLSHLVPALPPAREASRSPSSDVLMGALPYPNAAVRLDDLSQGLPQAPGVVVAHAEAGQTASAYFVVAMRLWPRPVSYVACSPAPRLEQFRSPHQPPRFAWRLDLRPGHPTPLQVGQGVVAQDPVALCESTQSR